MASSFERETEISEKITKIIEGKPFKNMLGKLSSREQRYEKDELLSECVLKLFNVVSVRPDEDDCYYATAAKWHLYDFLGLENQARPGARARKEMRKMLSLDYEIGGDDGDKVTLADMIAGNPDMSYEDFSMAKKIAKDAIEMLESMSETNLEIFIQRYYWDMSAKQVGELHGLTDTAVNLRMHNNAKKINEIMRSRWNGAEISIEVMVEAENNLCEYLEMISCRFSDMKQDNDDSEKE